MENILIYSILLVLSGIVIIAWLDTQKLNLLKYGTVVLYAVLGNYIAVIGSNKIVINNLGRENFDGNLFEIVRNLIQNITSVTDPLFRGLTLAFAVIALVILIAAIIVTVRASCEVIILIKRIRSKYHAIKLNNNVRKAHIKYTQRRAARRVFLRNCRFNN